MNVRFDNGNLAVERFATECCFSLKKKDIEFERVR